MTILEKTAIWTKYIVYYDGVFTAIMASNIQL